MSIGSHSTIGTSIWLCYPEGKAIEELPYPRAKAQRQVPVHTRVRLIERARMIGAAENAVA